MTQQEIGPLPCPQPITRSFARKATATVSSVSTAKHTTSAAEKIHKKVDKKLDMRGSVQLARSRKSFAWFYNSRNEAYYYRREIYHAVNKNLCYHADILKKDVEDTTFDQLVLVRCKYFASIGVDWVAPKLPSLTDTLPDDVLRFLERVKDKSGDDSHHVVDIPESLTRPYVIKQRLRVMKKPVYVESSDVDESPEPSLSADNGSLHEHSPPATLSDNSLLDPVTSAVHHVDMNTPSNVFCQPTNNPFKMFHARLYEKDPETYPLADVRLNEETNLLGKVMRHSALLRNNWKQLRIPEDKEFRGVIRAREEELREQEAHFPDPPSVPLVNPSTEFKVNMFPYAMQTDRISGEALPHGICRVFGQKPDLSPNHLVLLSQTEHKYHEETTRSEARILQTMRFALDTALADTMQSDLKDVLHYCLDDLYKLVGERLVNVVRQRQRSTIAPDDAAEVYGRLSTHSIVDQILLMPE